MRPILKTVAESRTVRSEGNEREEKDVMTSFTWLQSIYVKAILKQIKYQIAAPDKICRSDY